MSDKNLAQSDVGFLLKNRKHEDNIFYERLHFFLVAESMLFVALATLFGSSQSGLSIVTNIIETLGIVLTIIWAYVSARQLSVINHIREELLLIVPTYKRLRESRPKWPISAMKLMAYYIPASVLIAWMTLLIF